MYYSLVLSLRNITARIVFQLCSPMSSVSVNFIMLSICSTVWSLTLAERVYPSTLLFDNSHVSQLYLIVARILNFFVYLNTVFPIGVFSYLHFCYTMIYTHMAYVHTHTHIEVYTKADWMY